MVPEDKKAGARNRKIRKTETEKEDSSDKAELVTKSILEKLVKSGYLIGFIHAKPGSQLDAEGIDFLVFIYGGFMLPIQIKNRNKTAVPAEKIVKNHHRKHPNVQLILFVNTRRKNKKSYLRFLENKIKLFIRIHARKTAVFYPSDKNFPAEK